MASELSYGGEYEGHFPDEHYPDLDDYDNDEEQGGSRSPSPDARRLTVSSAGNSREMLPVAERPRYSRRERDRRRLSSYRELVNLLVSEERVVKQTQRALETALEQVRLEAERAEEAERCALEIAQRFKVVNDARIAAQQEAQQTREELAMYKLQLDNARRELSRGQVMMQDLESQRDDAEAAVARARTTARRLREQQIVSMAREDGRREGYEEGMRMGYDEARMGGYRSQRMDGGEPIADDADPSGAFQPGEETLEDQDRAPPLGEFSPGVTNLPSPSPGGLPLAPPSIAGTMDDDISVSAVRRQRTPYTNNAQGSRFQERIASPGASTLSSLPLGALQPGPLGSARYSQPSVVRTASPEPRHPNFYVPPDGWVPEADSDNYIAIPPPHELQPLASPHSTLSNLPDIPQTGNATNEPIAPHPVPPPEVLARDYAFLQNRGRTTPSSLADSLPSTNMSVSNFDVVNSPRMRNRDRLSAIPEVMERSPDTTRHSVMPDAVVFPAPSPGPEGRRSVSRNERRETPSVTESQVRRRSSRGTGESVRASSSTGVQDWLNDVPPHRATSPPDRPYSSASGDAMRHRRSRSMNTVSESSSLRHDRHRIPSTGSMAISVQPPSTGTSITSGEAGMDSGRLTPSTNTRPRPPRNVPAHVYAREAQAPEPPPQAHTLGHPSSMGSIASVAELPPGFVATSPPLGPPTVSNSPAPTSPRPLREQLYGSLGMGAHPPQPTMPPPQTQMQVPPAGDGGYPRSHTPHSADRANGMPYEPIRPRTPVEDFQPPPVLYIPSPDANRSQTTSRSMYVSPGVSEHSSRSHTPSQPMLYAPGVGEHSSRSHTPSHPALYAPAPDERPMSSASVGRSRTPIQPALYAPPQPDERPHSSASASRTRTSSESQPLYVLPPEPTDRPRRSRTPSDTLYVPPPSSQVPMLRPVTPNQASPRSVASRLSGHGGDGGSINGYERGSTGSGGSGSGGGHQRSRSMHAGATPAATFNLRPLSSASNSNGPASAGADGALPIPLRRVPSAVSIGSNVSRGSAYSHYDPKMYRDVAYLASSENLVEGRGSAPPVPVPPPEPAPVIVPAPTPRAGKQGKNKKRR